MHWRSWGFLKAVCWSTSTKEARGRLFNQREISQARVYKASAVKTTKTKMEANKIADSFKKSSGVIFCSFVVL